jgi:hypothetical protein
MSRLDLQASSGLVTGTVPVTGYRLGDAGLPLHRRVLHGTLVRLERSAVKIACCVLRGLGEGDLAWLPGDDRDNCLSEEMTETGMSG